MTKIVKNILTETRQICLFYWEAEHLTGGTDIGLVMVIR